MGSQCKNKFFYSMLLSVLLSVVLMTYLISRVDLKELLELLSSANIEYLLLSTLFLWLVFISNTLRYECILSVDIPNVSNQRYILHALTMLTSMLGAILPISALGDIARVGVLWKKFAMPAIKAIKSVIHDRFLALVLYLIYGLLFLPIQFYYDFPGNVLQAQLGLYVITTLVFMVCIIFFRFSRCAPGVKKHLKEFLFLLATKSLFLKHIVFSFIGIFSVAVSFWLCAVALDIKVNFIIILIFSPLLLIAQNIPVFFSGWGSRDALVMIILGSLFIEEVEALTVSILFGIVVLLSTLPGIFILIGYNKIFNIKKNENKKMIL